MTEPPPFGRHQALAKRLLLPIFNAVCDVEITGLDNVPEHGPAIVCANHLAAIDSFIIPAVLPRPVLFVGKSEYLDDWKTRWLFPALGMIPIDRRGGDHAKAALDAARAVLEQGGLFAIYPEGTRSRSGKLYRGHTGAARLAVETGAPIIPVGLVGTAEIQPVDVAMPRLFKNAQVNIGTPIPVDRYRDRIGDHALYRAIIDEVMFEIQALSGQEYVPNYAKDLADEQPASVPRRSSADVLVSRPLEPV